MKLFHIACDTENGAAEVMLSTTGKEMMMSDPLMLADLLKDIVEALDALRDEAATAFTSGATNG